jgi:small subunit ribosomal protein S2
MVIPGNDDAIRSIRLITKIIADSCARGLESSKGFSPKVDSESPVIQTIKKEQPVVAEPAVEETVVAEPAVNEDDAEEKDIEKDEK